MGELSVVSVFPEKACIPPAGSAIFALSSPGLTRRIRGQVFSRPLSAADRLGVLYRGGLRATGTATAARALRSADGADPAGDARPRGSVGADGSAGADRLRRVHVGAVHLDRRSRAALAR